MSTLPRKIVAELNAATGCDLPACPNARQANTYFTIGRFWILRREYKKAADCARMAARCLDLARISAAENERADAQASYAETVAEMASV